MFQIALVLLNYRLSQFRGGVNEARVSMASRPRSARACGSVADARRRGLGGD